MESESKRVEFANALRGIAALSVIVSHYLVVFWTVPSAVAGLIGLPQQPIDVPVLVQWLQIPGFNWGAFGVALFFIISGFVIPFSFRTYGRFDFLVGRFFRIYPTYWVGLSVSLIVVLFGTRLLGSPYPHSLTDVISNYLLGARDILWVKSVDGIVWTLEIELKFYIICAVIAPWLRDGSLKILLVPLALFALTLFLGWRLLSAETTRWFFMALSSPYVMFMFIGVIFNFHFREKITGASAALFIGCIVAMFCVSMWCGFFKTSFIIPSYIGALGIFAIASKFPAVLTSLPTIKFWSNISYPLYVVHAVAGYTAMTIMRWFDVPPILTVALTLCLTTSLAYAIHRGVELRSHKMGQQLAANFRARVRAPIAWAAK